jgi:hypothetical protein
LAKDLRLAKRICVNFDRLGDRAFAKALLHYQLCHFGKAGEREMKKEA